MNKTIKVGLLSLIAITQTITLVSGFFAYQQMSRVIFGLETAYKNLYEETHELIIDFGITTNPFAPLIPLILLGLLLTLVLLVDQVRRKNEGNPVIAAT